MSFALALATALAMRAAIAADALPPPPAPAPAAVVEVSYDEAIRRARQVSPDLIVARGREGIAEAEIGIAGLYPNPTLLGGTSTQAARLSAGVSVPLVILGQRGAAIRAGRADYDTVRVETEVALNDVRTATAKAFVALWLSQRTAAARSDAAAVSRRLDNAVAGRVELGAAPAVEGLRAHAERLRADADAQEAEALVDAAGSDLGRWLGMLDYPLRAKGDPATPEAAPLLASLVDKVGRNPAIRREDFDVRASELRADRERALVRPLMSVEVGVDAFDQTLCPGPGACNPPINYRAQLGVEVPIFNQRGGYIQREVRNAEVARARSAAQRARVTAGLIGAYRTYQAISARRKALEEGVVPAAEAAANATEESYSLGHAPLVAVLDAERARIDARIAFIEARAASANAWADVEQAIGWP